jgi:hypothetical protein
MIDIQTIHTGNLVGFQPNTDAGRDWLREEVQAEPWMYMGRVLYVDCRQASTLIEAAICDGIIVN